MSNSPRVKLLVVGQTPPPYVGQMLSIDTLVKAQLTDVEIHHVRMNYSHTVGEIGSVRIRKLFHLVRILFETGYKILRQRIDVIYYPPGAQTVPILRDIVTLLWLRLFRRKLLLVFYASGVSETAARWQGPLRWLFERAFFYPDGGVQNSLLNPPDAAFVRAKSVHCRANGVADESVKLQKAKLQNAVPVILFVGMVRADKGVDSLLAAALLLKQQGRKFLIRMVGEFASEEYRKQLFQHLQEHELHDCVEFTGRKIGSDKWQAYQTADMFCFPSYYAAESFGNVLLEAMMFELPVVTTRWRAIPGIVVEGETGFLVEIKDPAAIAERLARLLDDEDLRARMGRAGRARYLENYTIEQYLERTRQIILEVAGQKQSGVWSRESGVEELSSSVSSETGVEELSSSVSSETEVKERSPWVSGLQTPDPRLQTRFINVLGVNVSRVNYDSSLAAIFEAARHRRSFGATALAVHGLMEAHRDPAFAKLLNSLDLVTPDGQPVRWALNLLGAKELNDRVYGPTLTLKICAMAAAEKLPIFLYGSRQSVLDRLAQNLQNRFPGLIIAGLQADRFREATAEEDQQDIATIIRSGAAIVFVGRGCPRQERWVAAHLGKIPAAMIAVGAAFDLHAGTLKQAPNLLQDYGLEWLFRLAMEPKRLWQRYLVLNPLFVWNFGRQLVKTSLVTKEQSGVVSLES